MQDPNYEQALEIVEIMKLVATELFRSTNHIENFKGTNFLPISSLNLKLDHIDDIKPAENRPEGNFVEALIENGYILLNKNIILISWAYNDQLIQPVAFMKRKLPDTTYDVIQLMTDFTDIWAEYPPKNFVISAEFASLFDGAQTA